MDHVWGQVFSKPAVNGSGAARYFKVHFFLSLRWVFFSLARLLARYYKRVFFFDFVVYFSMIPEFILFSES